MCSNKIFNQFFLLFHIIGMLNFFMSLFAYSDANSKKTDIIIPNDIEEAQKLEDKQIDDPSYYEEYDSFCNENVNIPSPNKLIKKTSSLSQLPKCTDFKIDIDYTNPKKISQDNCYNCKIRIQKRFNPTYHAYDRIWCYKCWKKLDINF